MPMKKIFFAGLLLAIGALSPLVGAQKASAVTAADWKAGRIIDDGIFTNANDMSAADIQAFLNAKVPVCDSQGTKSVGYYYNATTGQPKFSWFSGGSWVTTTRAVFAQRYSAYYQTNISNLPFTCLKDYYEVPKTAAGPGLPASNAFGQPIPAGAVSAAQMIRNAAVKYNINPKVLLVKLHTESAGPLTTDDWPFQNQYLYAMGAHCPDSGPGGSANCNSNYAGFSIQIDEAAALLRWYLDSMTQSWWQYKKPYQTNSILWNVEPTSCGASNVYIETKATAALYTYTPYQPNQAALNNMYGTGDGCSAYGNRNFWRVYWDWFGNTIGSLWRTENNNTLYYVDGEQKFLLPSEQLITQYGFSAVDVRYVSQQQLDTMPLAAAPLSPSLGLLVKSPSDSDADGGNVYLIDRGQRILVPSIEQYVNYGLSTWPLHYLPLEDLRRLPQNQLLSSFLQAPDLSIYKMTSSKKQSIFEIDKFNQLNPSGLVTRMSSYMLSQWGFGQALVDGSYLVVGPDQSVRLYNGGSYSVLTDMNTFECWGFSSLRLFRVPTYQLTGGFSNGNLSCLAQKSTKETYLMNGIKKYQLSTLYGQSPSLVPDDVIDRLPSALLPVTVKNPAGQISALENGSRRLVLSMSDFSSLGYNISQVESLTAVSYLTLPAGPSMLVPGSVIVDGIGRVSVINNNGQRYSIGSPTMFTAYGYSWNKLVPVTDALTLDAYPETTQLKRLIKSDGKVYFIDNAVRYFVDTTTLDSAWGANILIDIDKIILHSTTEKTMTEFIKSSSNNTVYRLEQGMKRPITSWQKLVELGGQNSITSLSEGGVGSFPTGEQY